MVRSSSSGRAHPLAVACLVASSIAWSAQLRAQESPATPVAAPAGAAVAPPSPAGVVQPGPPVASPPAASPPAAADAADAEGLEEPSAGELPAPSDPAAGASSERSDLDLRMRQLEDERSSAVLPWLVFGGGTGIVLVSTALVTAQTLSCDGDDGSADDNGCETANWAALAVVAGSAVATLGAIWLVRVSADNAEVDLKQRSIQEDLQRLDARQQRARLGNAQSAPHVSMRWQF